MNSQPDRTIIADESIILARYRNDRKFLHEVYTVFLDEIPRIKKEFAHARENNLLGKIEDTAHPLRSSCGAIGAHACAESAARLEAAARMGNVEEVEECLAEVLGILDELETLLLARIAAPR